MHFDWSTTTGACVRVVAMVMMIPFLFEVPG
jgi:hypothetical protein